MRKIQKVSLNLMAIGGIVYACGILAMCAQGIYEWYAANHEVTKMTEEIRDILVVEEKEDTDSTIYVDQNIPEGEVISDYFAYWKVPFLSVDFTNLLAKNKDTVAFINVEGTNINYPVVQADDNDYYLKHSFDGKKNQAGWVFADYRNSFTELDKNTILYGHGRLDYTIFGSLKKVLLPSWQQNEENHVIRMSTPTLNTTWQVFSTYTIKEESYYLMTEFYQDHIYQKFLDTLKSRSNYDYGVTLSSTDKILTLSTCNEAGDRIVLHAKLIKQESRL